MNIRIDSEISKLPLLWTTLFLWRRLFIALATVFLVTFRWLQITICMLLTILTLCFLLTVRPFETKLLTNIEIVNELFVLSSCYTMLLYADMLMKEETRQDVAKFSLYSCGLVIFVNISAAVYAGLSSCNRERRIATAREAFKLHVEELRKEKEATKRRRDALNPLRVMRRHKLKIWRSQLDVIAEESADGGGDDVTYRSQKN